MPLILPALALSPVRHSDPDHLEARQPWPEQILVHLKPRTDHRHAGARLPDESPDRREPNLERVHPHFRAGIGVAISHGGKLDHRPGVAFDRQRHVTKFEFAALRQRSCHKVADRGAQEWQRDRVDQQCDVENQREAERHTEQPRRNAPDRLPCRALPNRLTWGRGWLQLASGKRNGGDPARIQNQPSATGNWSMIPAAIWP